MVSTPIGPTHNQEASQKPVNIISMSQVSNTFPHIPNSTPIMQPTLQTGLPYMSNLFAPSPQTQHTFPVLYNSPMVIPSTTTTEVQPMSLYAEYIGNPYNIPSPDVYKLDVSSELLAENVESKFPSEESNFNVDLNKNTSIEEKRNNNPANFFQSSNYFSNASAPNLIPAGSEILFGVEQANINLQNVNIPITTNESRSTDI